MQSHCRLLLIEDSNSDAAIIKEMLNQDPLGTVFEITRCTSVADGLAATKHGNHRFDIILLDLNLPDSNGIDTFRKVYGEITDVPIIVLTSLGGEEFAAMAVEQGAQDFLFKDRLDSYWVTQSIRHAIGRSQLINRVKLAERRELEAAQKSSKAKTDFLTAMSHEIRTPISSILMASDYLLKNKAQPQNSSEPNFLQMIHRSGKHLLTLINDLLDLSKVESGCLAIDQMILPLRATVEEVVATFKILAESKGLALILDFAEDLPKAFTTDVTRFNQILSNLVSNAIKFTEKGSVTVRTSLKEKNSESVLEISVIDTGLGISEEQTKRLFQAYSQADSSIQHKFGGTGLGLILSKKLALAMGGTLELTETAPGKGSTFTLKLSIRMPTKSTANVELAFFPTEATQRS